MSMLLFIVGGVAVMIGAATIAFGVPINEFSFGNTLIVSGTTIGAAGLIVIAVAAAVAQLQRIAQALAEHAPPAHPVEAFEPAPEARAVPFPPKTRPAEPRERHGFEPAPLPPDVEAEGFFAPALRNPEAPPPTVEEEVPLSPPFGNGTPAGLGEPSRPAPPPSEPAFEAPWRSAPPPPRETPRTNFDAMWPARPRAAAEPAAEATPEPPAPPPPEEETPAPPPRTVAILKSGVVDGMAYTLYVDGSIEAELPQGTLRFASIDELRAYLETKS